MTPRIYETNDAGFTVDGYYLGGAPKNPDVFQHQGPLPEMKDVVVRVHPIDDPRLSSGIPLRRARRIASFDAEMTEKMRAAYGNSDIDISTDNDGAHITYSSRPEDKTPAPIKPEPLTIEQIAEMHGQQTLSRSVEKRLKVQRRKDES